MGISQSRCESEPGSNLSTDAESIAEAIRRAQLETTETATNSSFYSQFLSKLGISRTYLPNPGSYEDLNLDATLILRPNIFDGFQFSVNLPVSPYFQVGHSWMLGSSQIPPNYGFSANYFSNKVVMMSRLDPSGRVNARTFYNHTPSLTSKIMAETSPEPHSARGTWDLDYRGSDFCLQLKAGTGGIGAVSYLQSVTPTIAIGGEGFYQGKSRFSAISFAAKYVNDADVATITIASFGPIVASYVRKVTQRCVLATELFWDARSRDTLLTAGYKFELNKASVVAQIDSNGRVAGYIEEKLNPGLSLLLSGELDHVKAEYRFGFGLQIGQ